MRRRAEAAIGLVLLLLAGCSDPPVPKPRGYFRIDLPPQAYVTWDPDCPFRTEIPAYAAPVSSPRADQPCWLNLTFPGQRAIVHLTYLPVDNDLPQLIGEVHAFKAKHEAKADRITNERVLLDSTHVYGTLFDVEGDVAAPFVFYVTDSTEHFLYGALYFSARPNGDSLAPVTARLREDLRHLVHTLRWK